MHLAVVVGARTGVVASAIALGNEADGTFAASRAVEERLLLIVAGGSTISAEEGGSDLSIVFT